MSENPVHDPKDKAESGLDSQGAAPRVLCAEDDEAVRELCVASLERAGFIVDVAPNGRDALDLIEKRRYSAVLLDLSMPYLHGTTLLSLIRTNKPDLISRVIVMTGISDAGLLGTEDVTRLLRKPFGRERLIEAVSECSALDDTVRMNTSPGL